MALYTRVSTEEQQDKGWSLSAQADALKKSVFDSLGVKNCKLFSDTATGQSMDRPGLSSLLSFCDSTKKITGNFLYIWRPDRLSRNQSDFWAILARLQKAGYLVRFLEPWLEAETAQGRFMLGVLASFSEYEISTLCMRTRLGQAKAKSEGIHCGGAGYGAKHNEDGKLILEESEQKILQEIIDMWKSGRSFRAIADHLNKKGVKRKRSGSKWWASTVRSVLKNAPKVLQIAKSVKNLLQN